MTRFKEGDIVAFKFDQIEDGFKKHDRVKVTASRPYFVLIEGSNEAWSNEAFSLVMPINPSDRIRMIMSLEAR